MESSHFERECARNIVAILSLLSQSLHVQYVYLRKLMATIFERRLTETTKYTTNATVKVVVIDNQSLDFD